jgi:hypothetical protein
MSGVALLDTEDCRATLRVAPHALIAQHPGLLVQVASQRLADSPPSLRRRRISVSEHRSRRSEA